MIARHLDRQLLDHVSNRREVLILLGARHIGKTTILKRLFPQANLLSVDIDRIRQALNKFDPIVYRDLFGENDSLVVIDEAQQLKDPGRTAKIIHDQLPQTKLILTGSSALRIKNKTSESLAGRKVDYHLYPLSFGEFLYQKSLAADLKYPVLPQLEGIKPFKTNYQLDLSSLLDNVLIFGLYPHLVSQPQDQTYLKNLADSVIYKDLFDLSLVENRDLAKNLLKLLAYQIGSLVNYSELATKLGVEARTIKRYISLFEQSFLVFTLPPFSKNPRLEIGKMAKIYFYDVGLRNAIIENFDPLIGRADSGALWENFLVSEIGKSNYYGNFGYNLNFWRTKSGSEVDLVLSRKDEPLIGLEIKNHRHRINMSFVNHYPGSKLFVIDKENFF